MATFQGPKLVDCNPTLFSQQGSFYFDIKSDLKSYLTRFFKSSTKQYDVTLHTPDSKLFKGRHACLPLTRKKFGLTFSFASGRKHYFWQRETCQGLVTFSFFKSLILSRVNQVNEIVNHNML